MAEKVRIGLLGAGAMGSEHAGVYAEMPDVAVVGVFSRELGRARAVAASCGAAAFDAAAALIARPDIDAIDICLPTSEHAGFACLALQAGKHVFCETPMTVKLDEAHQMLAAARAAGRLLQVGLLMRSVAYNAHVKALVDSGEHGRLLSVATQRLGSYLRDGAAEHKAHYSDPTTELMTFDFDFVRWLMGPPRLVSASAAGDTPGAPLEVSALIAYGDGRHATVAASGYMPGGYPFTVGFRALFERAVVELSAVFGDGPPATTFTPCDDAGPLRPIPLAGANPYAVELRRFVDCIRGQADPGLLDAERALEALLLSDATQRSLTGGCTIELTGAG